MNVLIADDDRVLTHLLSARFRKLGWTVSIALDAMQAVMFAMRTVPDAILLDIQMPGGTGIEALKKLKQSTKTSQIPVVVHSGSIDAAAEDDILGLGAEAFVRKPADPDYLVAALLRAAGRETGQA